MNFEASDQARRQDRAQERDSASDSNHVIDEVRAEFEEKLFLIEKENDQLKEEIKRRAAIEKELVERHNALDFIANHDPLTGLPNRRSLMTHLKALLGDKEGASQYIAVGFMDLDNFKSINDRFGHAAGDLVLLKTAERLKRLINTDLVIGRLAGDEFLIIVKQLNGKMKTIERITEILEIVEKPITLAETELQISASLGIACYPDPATDLRSLLRLADQAMYQAKFDKDRIPVISYSLAQKTDNTSFCRRVNRRS
ncbi:diguanylate cyclase domain-containing protein [Arenicellales bacterium nBUS_45]